MLSPIRSKKNFAGLSGSTAAQPRVYFQNFAQRTSQGIQPGNVFINQNFGRAFIGSRFFLEFKTRQKSTDAALSKFLLQASYIGVSQLEKIRKLLTFD